MFTCLPSRVVHIEINHKLIGDRFIYPCTESFIARRGNVRIMTTENGTNFVGVDNDLKKLLVR